MFQILMLESAICKKLQLCAIISNFLSCLDLHNLLQYLKKEQHTCLPGRLVVDDTKGPILNPRSSDIRSRTNSAFLRRAEILLVFVPWLYKEPCFALLRIDHYFA